MNQDEAQAEAVKRWGQNAIARPYMNGLVEIVIDIHERLPGWNVKKFGPIVRVLGWGATWEEALENASNGQHEGYQVEPAQLDLFK